MISIDAINVMPDPRTKPLGIQAVPTPDKNGPADTRSFADMLDAEAPDSQPSAPVRTESRLISRQDPSPPVSAPATIVAAEPLSVTGAAPLSGAMLAPLPGAGSSAAGQEVSTLLASPAAGSSLSAAQQTANLPPAANPAALQTTESPDGEANLLEAVVNPAAGLSLLTKAPTAGLQAAAGAQAGMAETVLPVAVEGGKPSNNTTGKHSVAALPATQPSAEPAPGGASAADQSSTDSRPASGAAGDQFPTDPRPASGAAGAQRPSPQARGEQSRTVRGAAMAPLSPDANDAELSPDAQAPSNEGSEATAEPIVRQDTRVRSQTGGKDARQKADLNAAQASGPNADISPAIPTAPMAAEISEKSTASAGTSDPATPSPPALDGKGPPGGTDAPELAAAAGGKDLITPSHGRAGQTTGSHDGMSEDQASLPAQKPAEVRSTGANQTSPSHASGLQSLQAGLSSPSEGSAPLSRPELVAQSSGTATAAAVASPSVSLDAPKTSAAAATSYAAPSAAVQVYTRMIERFDGRAQRYEIRLHPEELGRVDVRIEVGADKKVHAVLAAHDSSALSDLMRGHRALETALRQAGVDVADGGIRFELSGDNGRNQSNGAPYGDPRGGQSGPNSVWRDFSRVNIEVDKDAAAAARPWRSSRLDLFA